MTRDAMTLEEAEKIARAANKAPLPFASFDVAPLKDAVEALRKKHDECYLVGYRDALNGISLHGRMKTIERFLWQAGIHDGMKERLRQKGLDLKVGDRVDCNERIYRDAKAGMSIGRPGPGVVVELLSAGGSCAKIKHDHGAEYVWTIERCLIREVTP